VRARRTIVLVAAGVVLFALGVAVGEALHDNPRPGGTQTRIRTLTPTALPPAPITVTVTTSGS
jgi:hypothetical protein